MSTTLAVPPLTSPTRLDHYLVANLPGISRSRIQAAIREELVRVNGEPVVVHRFLKAGDRIEVPEFTAAAAAPTLTAEPDVNFRVVAETADFLAVEKPSGLLVHPAPGAAGPTLAGGLLARYPELAGVGDDPLRPGIVHRLDREVSGLMVVARTPAAFTHLKQAFIHRQVDKRYLALVVGRPVAPSGTISFPLARSRRHGGKMAARAAVGGDTREAVTHFEILKQYQEATLLTVVIKTGRTHQIRAHLAAFGLPIVGDTLYRPSSLGYKASPGRLFLHASHLAFPGPDGQSYSYESPLPAELESFLTTLA